MNRTDSIGRAHRDPPVPPVPGEDPDGEPSRQPPVPPGTPYPGRPQVDPPLGPPGEPNRPPPEIITRAPRAARV